MFVVNAMLRTGTLSSRMAKKTGELIKTAFKHNRQHAPISDRETDLACFRILQMEYL